MTSLSEAIAHAAAFDEVKSFPARDRITERSVKQIESEINALAKELEIDPLKAEIMLLMGYNIAWTNSARYENARLAPLIAALGAVAVAADGVVQTLYDASATHPEEDHALLCTARVECDKALARLREVVGE